MAKRISKTPEDIPRELERAGELCLVFANTAAPRLDNRSSKPGPPDPSAPPVLGHYADLIDWGRRMGVLKNLDAERLAQAAVRRPQHTATIFARALSLRDSLMRVFTAVAFGKPAASKDLDLVNDALVAAVGHRRLVGQGKGFEWEWESDEEAFEAMLWPVATSAADLLFSDDLRWVRQCGGQYCTRLFVDRKSHKRVWCDMNTCGSRLKGMRHYKRSVGRRIRHQF